MKSSGIATGLLALVFAIPTAATAAPEPSPSPSPSAQASQPAAPDASTGGFDASKLTPAQQDALRLAIIKTSQNPVGNITVVPFQNNFNYGVGPYTRLQYNLNVQPVVPIMLSTNMTLIARTIFPIINQPSAAPPPVCASPPMVTASDAGRSATGKMLSKQPAPPPPAPPVPAPTSPTRARSPRWPRPRA